MLYRHYFDASATKSVTFPGAIVDKTLRYDDYSDPDPRSVFLEGATTGLVSMGLDVYMPDVTAPVLGTYGYVYASPVVTVTVNFTDAGTNTGDTCSAYLQVTLNGAVSYYPCTCTAGFGTIVAVGTFPMTSPNTAIVKISVSDAQLNWVDLVKCGASYTV